MAVPLDPQYIDAIRGFEGYSPRAAWDYKQSSSGYGTKAQPGDESLSPEQLKAVHEQRFQDEIKAAAAHVDSVNPNLPQGARAALIDLTYNAGPGWAKSGLGELVRSGDLQGAQARLLEYNKAGGQTLPGLVKRRQTAAGWFGGDPATSVAPAQQNAQPSPAATANSPPLQLTPQAAPQAPISLPSFSPPLSTGGAASPQMEAPPMAMAAPIFPARKPVNLSGLQAALQDSFNRGPIFRS